MNTKKLFSALLSVLIVLMMLPTAAFAAGEDAPGTLYVGQTQITADSYWKTNSNGTLTSEGASEDNYNVYYDGNGTLTLNNATIKGVDQNDGAGIYSEGGTLKIEFSGDNTVTGAGSSKSTAIYGSNGSFIFSSFDSGTLTVTGGAAAYSYGVSAKSVTVSGGTLDANGGAGGSESYGVFVSINGSVTVSGGTLTATGGQASDSYGVYVNYGNVTVSGGTLDATGGQASDSYGVFAGSIEVSGGALKATGGQATFYSYGVSVNNGDVTVSGGTLTATGGEANFSYGVSANSVTVSGGTLAATGGEANFSYGVSANSVTVSERTLAATGGQASFYSYGVSVNNGDVTVSGGTLAATGGQANFYSYGVSVNNGDVTVGSSDSSGAVLVASGTNSEITQNLNSLVMQNGTGTVKGSVTLTEDLTVSGTLTIKEGATLTIPADVTLTNNGTVTTEEGGSLTNNGTIVNKGTMNGDPTGGSGTVVNAPAITTQPADQTVTEGGTATFTVAVTGSEPLTYQWQQKTTDSSSWTNIPGANSATYTTEATTTAMNGYQYRCVVSNGAGSVTSEAATLTVNAKSYTITTTPSTLDFGSVTEGYTAVPQAQTVKVTNTGNQTVTVNLPSATNYIITAGTGFANGKATLNVNETATFTVQPKAGLQVGNYSQNLTVSETNGTSASVTLGFVVAAKPAPTEYTIYFDANGGFVSYSSATTSGRRLASLPYAVKYGYTFTGWYTANGYPISTDTTFSANTTLYAGWVYNQINIPVQPSQPVKPVQPVEPEYEWLKENGGTRLYFDGKMITGWYQDEKTGVWYWLDQSSGFMAADQWVKVDGVWYLFAKDGSMLTGWQKVDGIWYYLKPWGGMATGWQYIDNVWYFLRSDGSMAANSWVLTSGKWYYLTGSGEMATNKWVQWKGEWYFLYSSGVMATNTTIDGYRINSAGVWVQ